MLGFGWCGALGVSIGATSNELSRDFFKSGYIFVLLGLIGLMLAGAAAYAIYRIGKDNE